MNANVKDSYERKFLELLLRHQLPEECEVAIDVKPKASKTSGKTVFTLGRDGVNVKSDLSRLNLERTVPLPWCW